MTVATQNRLPLHRAVQQHDASLMAQVVSLQMQAFAAAGALGAEYDIAVCDATAGAFTLDLPTGAEVYIGKEYSVKETSGANAVTVRGYGGAGTIDGGASLVVPALQAAVFTATEIAADGAVTWQKISSSSATGADSTAIHVDIANELGGIAAKAAPTILDVGVIEDAAAAGVKKSIVLGAIMKAVGWVTGLTAKTAPTGADLVAIEDAAAAGAIKKSTLAQVFAAIAGLTAKVTPTGADTFLISDAAASGAAKSVALSTLVLVSNNLSDVTAATARANLVANRKTLVFTRVDVVGATAAVYRYQNVSGNSETVLKIGSALSAALATGDATITASIDGVAVTSGVVTIAQVGSAAGTKDSATPSAANVIANGASLELTVGGTNDAAVFADVSVELSY